MFTIIQSHRTENLVDQLLEQYQSKSQHVFEPFIVIVPSMVFLSILSSVCTLFIIVVSFGAYHVWKSMTDHGKTGARMLMTVAHYILVFTKLLATLYWHKNYAH